MNRHKVVSLIAIIILMITFSLGEVVWVAPSSSARIIYNGLRPLAAGEKGRAGIGPEEAGEAIRAEGKRLIENGQAIVWKWDSADKIVKILEKKGKLKDKDCKKLLKLFKGLPPKAQKKLKQNLRSWGRQTRRELALCIRAQQDAIDNIHNNKDYYLGMVKPEYRGEVESNLDGLKERRFIIFLSNEGLFYDLNILGHYCPN